IALQPTSPAIDAIPNGQNGCGTAIVTDQTGSSRAAKGSLKTDCDIGAFETLAVPPVNVNDRVTFDVIRSTVDRLPDITGCPAGFIGKLTFTAQLGKSGLSLPNLIVGVAELSNGNLLLLSDGLIGGVGTTFGVPDDSDPTADVDVKFAICL